MSGDDDIRRVPAPAGTASRAGRGREARLAEALRANLARRKARGRSGPASAPGPGPGAPEATPSPDAKDD